MQVVLLERVENLGQMGDVVKVRPGYARNYLLPLKKALRASAENLTYFETRRAELETINLQRRQEAEAAAEKLKGLSVTIIRRAGDTGQLYGSVSSRDIVEALREDGVKIERQQISLVRPIKTLGLHEVRLVLHPEVSVGVQANVARTADEADAQARGEDLSVVRDDYEFESNVEEMFEEGVAPALEGEEAGDEAR
jgi:large subunit ribosomal protein L9